MLNNPFNLNPDEYLDQMVRPGTNPVFVQFMAPERRNSVLYHVLCRVVWDRNGEPSLMRDHSWHFSESPERLR